MKSFYSNRLLGKYWRIIIDGTGLFYFKEKHCSNCLVQTVKIDENTTVKAYYHKVLEAKLVLGNKIVLSIDTEFIENESEAVSKQDCEITAAKRLLKRLAKDYPRLPICLQGDNLYSAETIMEMCRKRDWKYIFFIAAVWIGLLQFLQQPSFHPVHLFQKFFIFFSRTFYVIGN